MDKELAFISSKELEKILETEEITDNFNEIKEIGEKMIKLCVSNGGLGLAAPQVGIKKRFFVYSYENKKGEKMMEIIINPMFFPQEKKITKTIEGCLSYPGKHFICKRYKYIRAVYYTTDGEKLYKIVKNLSGERAIIFQHETNHLFGKHCGIVGEEVG